MLIHTLDPSPAADGRLLKTLLHAGTDLRVVLFRLAPGQAIPPHVSRSTVLLVVLAGHGTLQCGEALAAAGPGDLLVVEPMALHGLAAGEEPFTVLAAIAPAPGSAPRPPAGT